MRKYLPFIILLISCMVALLPLFKSGFFPIHDDEQVGRLYEIDVAVKAGHIPPRIAPDLGFGYDYPLFNFYPPFVYYLAEIFVLLGFSYIASIKIMIAVGFVLAAVCMYLFSRKYLGVMGGIVAAIAYSYVPYHSVDVYVRGALPEFFSFVFIPAIFWSLKKIDEGKNIHRYIVITAICIACLILTHNLVAFMSVPFLSLYVLFLTYFKKRKKVFITQTFLTGVLGLLLSAFFWVPSFFEKKYTMIELLTKELADYKQHFVYIRQLWDSPWGYGGSVYGLYDGLSFQIGKLHIILFIISIGVAFYLLKKRKESAKAMVILFFAGLLVLAAFMTTFYSQVIWDTIQPLSYIQFPWRYLLFTAFASSFLAGSLFALPIKRNSAIILAIIIGISIVVFYGKYFQPEKYYTSVTDKDYISHDVLEWRTSIMAFEYVPYGVKTKKSDLNTTIIDINRDQVSKASYVAPNDIQVRVVKDLPHKKEFLVVAKKPGALQINTYSFPGWIVKVDDNDVRYSDNNALKLITVAIPVGSHRVDAEFVNTPLRNEATVATIIGIIMALGIWFNNSIKKIYGK